MNWTAMSEKFKRIMRRYLELAFADALVVVVSLWLSWSIRAVTALISIQPLFIFTILSVLTFWLSNFVFRLYHRMWRYASAADVIAICGAVLQGTAIITALDLLWPGVRPLPLSVVLLTGFFSFVGFVAVRYRRRVWSGIHWRLDVLRTKKSGRERILVVGAGEAGEILARRFLSPKVEDKFRLVGFIDDDPSKHKMLLYDLPIFGDRYQIPALVANENIDLIIIAIYNITGENFRNVLEICEKTPARIKVIPDLIEFIHDRPGMPAFRDISSEDLLGRKMVDIDETACRSFLEGQRILVTGAAGSIGSELCRQIIKYKPKQLLMLDNNESGLYELHNGLSHTEYAIESVSQNPHSKLLRAIVGSVTNRSKMNFVFDKYRPNIVFHAAAYKHVPMMEDQPDEALWVNVFGTKNLMELSKEYGVKCFVFISTDKAVQPVCMMGATKWLGELMMMNPDSWSRRVMQTEAVERRRKKRPMNRAIGGVEDSPAQKTLYTVVRFGNVLSSRGSVVPAFEQQIRAGGPVKVTHPDMTRYFMSIVEAVRLVIQAATFTTGKDIFMLDMGERIKIDDLARRLIRLRGARPGIDVPIIYTGIRPGEKLHEELMGPTENRQLTQHECIFRIQKTHNVLPESLASEIDQLIPLAKEHNNEELMKRLQDFVAKEDGLQPEGRVLSFRGPSKGKTALDGDDSGVGRHAR